MFRPGCRAWNVGQGKYYNVRCTTCGAAVGSHCVTLRAHRDGKQDPGSRLHGTHRPRIERSKRYGKKTNAART